MKKILVTGAGGYIGQHVVNSLAKENVEVIAVDIKFNEINPKVLAIESDIFSGNTDIYKEFQCPDICIHLAWKDGFIHNSNAHMELLSKHYEFIKNMVEGGLKHISVMGTMHEIGYHEGAIDENTICNPISMYGIAKDSLRRSIIACLKDKNVILQWLRAYYIYGDDKRNNSIFAKIANAAYQGKKTFPFTTGKNKYDFIHVEKLAEMIAIASMQDEITGIINCCTGIPISLADKVESYIKYHEYDIKLEYGAFPDRPYDSAIVWGDNQKILKIMELS